MDGYKELEKRKRIIFLCLSLLIVFAIGRPRIAYAMPQQETPDYKVAFYAFDCYHMQDENGKRSGYGYEMMQGISKYLQCTFSYVGYEQSAEEDKTEFAGRKLLLVEDNALNAEIAIELLQTIGLVVDWAENGQLGVERYRVSEIDEYFAIFMDMQMPVMDGVTATKMIRQSNRSDHDMSIFAMTANTFASDRKIAARQG